MTHDTFRSIMHTQTKAFSVYIVHFVWLEVVLSQGSTKFVEVVTNWCGMAFMQPLMVPKNRNPCWKTLGGVLEIPADPDLLVEGPTLPP